MNLTPSQMKVEPALFYHACDEMGLVVIQDMPALRPLQSKTSANCTSNTVLPDAQQQNEFIRQLELLIQQQKSFPSISTWVSESFPVPTLCYCANYPQIIYNEGWGQITEYYPEFELTDLVQSLDPTRLVDSTSGWFDHGAGDFSVRLNH